MARRTVELAESEPEGNEPLPRVQRSALGDDVYDTVRGSILNGRLAPGYRVVEERLAAQLGVSRAPLREAIWRLKADGLIVGTGRSTRVVALSERDVRELHLVRATLETALYHSAATIITDSDVKALERLIRKMEMAASAPEQRHERLAQLDFEFHQMLCQIADLPRLSGAWEDEHVLFRLWLSMVADAADDPMTIAQHHRTLLAAVTSGDPVRIAVETWNHIYGVTEALVTERRRWKLEHAELTGDPYGIARRAASRHGEDD